MSRLAKIGEVFSRRWRLFVLLIVVMLVGVAITYRPNLLVYRSEIRFLVAQSPLETTAEREEERYYNWVASEYIVYGVRDYVDGTRFVEQIGLLLEDQGYADLDLQELDNKISSGAIRSRLIVAVADTDEQTVRDISAAIRELLSNPQVVEQLEIPQLERAAATISPIDGELYLEELDLRSQAITGLIPRLLTVFVAAVVIVLLTDLLDPTIRNRDGVALLNLPVIGEIPSEA